MMQARSARAKVGRGRAGVDVGALGGDQGVPVVEGDVAGLAAGQRLHADHRLAAVRADRGGQQGPGQLLGRDDDGAGAAVVEDVLVVALGVGDVGRHGDAARGHDGEVGDQPFGPVLGDQHHPVARARARAASARRRARRPCPRPRASESSCHAPSCLAQRKGASPFCLRAGEEHGDEIFEMFELAHSLSRAGLLPASPVLSTSNGDSYQ